MRQFELVPLKGPVNTTVDIPGSKSYTNRALIMAAQVEGDVLLKNVLHSDDTEAMMRCLNELGIQCEKKGGDVLVHGGLSRIVDREYTLDANLSGTTIRFLAALLCVVKGKKLLTGGEGLQKRPIRDLVDALRLMGADISYTKTEGCPPLSITSGGVISKKTRISGAVSSQFLSALLMVGPSIGGLEAEVIGDQISRSYVDMTMDSMRAFGAEVSRDGNIYTVTDKKYNITEYVVEGDYSAAGYFAAIAKLTGSRIELKNLNADSKQGDKKFIEMLERMGTEIKAGEYDMNDCPDQAQTMAVLMAFAEGKSVLTGVRSLRVKETERVKALESELAKMGIKTESTEDVLTIYGGNPHTPSTSSGQAATIDTYGDHRMAMSFAVAGAKLAGMKINDPEVVNKTFPEFWEKLKSLGINILEVSPLGYKKNIVLIGMRGSGKSTVAKLLADRLGMPCVEVDDEIVKHAGMSIREMVIAHGWDYFRDRESEAVREVAQKEGVVISTGGGAVVRPENVTALKKNGVFVYLRASVETLRNRMGNDPERPALTQAGVAIDEIEDVYLRRSPVYESAADIVIDSDGLTAESVVDKVFKAVHIH